MPTLTATSIITSSIKLLQWLGFNSDPPITAMLDDGLVYLQDMINNANLSSGMWVALAKSTFTPAAGTTIYTIGPSMVIDIPRPPKIVAASMLNQFEDPFEVIQDVREWTALRDPKRVSRMSKKMFYDRGNPTGNLYISPTPGAAPTGTITIWYPQTQTNFADKTTGVEILPGYARYLRFGLANEFASTYGMQVPATVANAYKQALDAIVTLNSELFVPTDPQPAPTEEVTA